MAADITYTGTFTPLATNLAALQDAALGGQQAAFLLNIAPNDLLTIPDGGSLPPEIDLIIQLFQVGWGALIPGAVTGTRLDYWTTAALLQKMLTSHITRGAPRMGALK